MKPLSSALLPAAMLALVVASPAVLPGQTLAPTITVDETDCIPNNDNGLIRATVQPEVGGAEVRLYFRWDDHGPFYYVLMDAEGAGRYWTTPPKPIDENHQVEYYVAVVDPQGTSLGESEPVVTPVTGDCDVELSREERGMAENLVVGETTDEQLDDMVYGFLCDGIISRIGSDGVLRADSICRRCIVAWWDKPEALLPAAVLLGGTTVVEASPSRP